MIALGIESSQPSDPSFVSFVLQRAFGSKTAIQVFSFFLVTCLFVDGDEFLFVWVEAL